MKHARDMTDQERQAALRAARALELEPDPSPRSDPPLKTAKEMTEGERQDWLANHKRRFR
jgi:hypothetical protein